MSRILKQSSRLLWPGSMGAGWREHMVGVRRYSGFGRLEEFGDGKELQDGFTFLFLYLLSSVALVSLSYGCCNLGEVWKSRS